MATKKKHTEKKVVEEKLTGQEFSIDEFTISYKIQNPDGCDRSFDGWLIEQLENRFPVVSCDLELSTRIRRINFRR